ncbi:MAG: UDP-N-acetylglucosamine 2-epimerase (hydrolyzing) [Rhodobacteraceae bacterium]|nr:UDP-N-acetylglucosamine 2-epimerase (hydrolyzing) [Paracoccaceae bacterium]
MYIHYVSGSRADFGLMQKTLTGLSALPGLRLSVVVTGQHLLAEYGNTIQDIVASCLPIAARIPVSLSGSSGAEMGRALATELLGFLDIWKTDRPDLVMVLGDRGEMLAATLAAVHLGIHVAHLHGGELSGTLDESFRHAISKLAHFHLVATADSAERLRRMGESSERIWVVGAPGLVGLTDGGGRREGWLARNLPLGTGRTHRVLVVFHPVVQEATSAADQISSLLQTLRSEGCAALVMRPNSDAGGAAINRHLDALQAKDWLRIVDHLDRDTYLAALAQADAIIGNSSSGIIESATLGTPCLNLGSRQNGRLRNSNVVDCLDFAEPAIRRALRQTLALQGPFENLYGDGRTTDRLAALLPSLPLDVAILAKGNAY